MKNSENGLRFDEVSADKLLNPTNAARPQIEIPKCELLTRVGDRAARHVYRVDR